MFYPSTQEAADLCEIELNLVHIVSPRTEKDPVKRKKKEEGEKGGKEGGKKGGARAGHGGTHLSEAKTGRSL